MSSKFDHDSKDLIMKKIILLILSMALLSSCSVLMAAKKDGVNVDKVQNAKTRSQIIASGGTIISSERNEKGELVEIYLFKRETGSLPRAFMHGCLDVCTWGLWEVAGTTIEGYQNQPEFYTVKITYDNQECVKRMEL